MFTGLIGDVGDVVEERASGEGVRLAITTRLAPELAEGDSIAVDGVCLTATRVGDDRFWAEVMNETVRRARGARAGDRVNLELALRAADRLGGHLVSGHVDGVGTVVDVRRDGFARVVRVAVPGPLARYVVLKGSIVLDGVSLTVAELDDDQVAVSLIPETAERTTLGALRPGDRVNVEVDMLAKYLERLVVR